MTGAELQMLRNADPGVVLPGLDSPTGNQTSPSQLKPLSSIAALKNPGITYDPTHNLVRVMQAGAVLNGYDFSSATVYIAANNVTVENSTFSGTSGFYSVQAAGASGTVIKNDTFNGEGSNAGFITSRQNITVIGNTFIAASGDAVDLGAGTVSNNYFEGGGFSTIGAHSDAIWVTDSTGPVSITGNLIDWTTFISGGTNNAVRISTEQGGVSNVTVSKNYLLGGSYTIDAGNKKSGAYAYSAINIANNYIGFGMYGAFYPGAQQGVATSGNVVFDWTNPTYSSQAWAAYKSGLPATGHLIVSTGSNISGAATGGTTLYGGGLKTHMGGTINETNFVGGFGTQYMIGGTGANIFTYLAISDSTVNRWDEIANFDSAKDVIDLSHIDANLTTAGVQNFTFIGTAPFSGSGAQVRYEQDPAHNVTYVEAALAGDASPDLSIQLAGLQTLTSANFALAAAQSIADMANGAALKVAETRAPGLTEDFYTNVKGRSYSSFEAIYASSTNRIADVLNLNSGASELVLNAGNLTVSRSATSETLQYGTNAAALTRNASETIDASGGGAETFALGAGFGAEAIAGFAVSGANADTIQFSLSAFSYLNSGMTQAQDLAAVLANASSGAAGTTIKDTAGDVLTLAGLTAAAIAANPSQFHFA